jgi:hypothetical protein
VRLSLHVLGAALAALPLLGLVACDQGAPTGESPTDARGALASTSLLHLMVGAPQRVEFQGVRRYEARWSDASGPHALVYREEVSSDGRGRFAVDPVELIEPALSPAQEAQFLLLQKLREGLFFRYRDFTIRDVDAFARNYVADFTGQQLPVAGHLAERLQIEASSDRVEEAGRRYTVDVDPSNGLVLRVREELADGTLVSLSEFESLTYTPDLTGVVFNKTVSGEESLPTGTPLTASALGFQPHPPKAVPHGWRLHEVATLTDPTTDLPWVKLVYTDGLEVLFFAEAGPGQPTFQSPGAAAPQPPRLRSLSIGSWTVLQGQIDGRELVVMGRSGEDVLADLVRSAF